MAQSNFKPRHKTHQTKAFSHRKEWLKLYETPEWKIYRVKFLKENPLCYACGNKSEVVDHIIPHQGKIELFTLRQNHIPLCKSCHNTVTAKFDRYHVHGKSVEPKAKYLKDTHDKNGLTFKIKVMPSYP
jgi:5-methylcytosine-specific restriction protein A